jgi:hypothetical protein
MSIVNDAAAPAQILGTNGFTRAMLAAIPDEAPVVARIRVAWCDEHMDAADNCDCATVGMTPLLFPSVELALVGPKGRGWTEAPYAKCGDCRLVFADGDLTYSYGADDWLCPTCLHAPNPCRIDDCSRGGAA